LLTQNLVVLCADDGYIRLIKYTYLGPYNTFVIYTYLGLYNTLYIWVDLPVRERVETCVCIYVHTHTCIDTHT